MPPVLLAALLFYGILILSKELVRTIRKIPFTKYLFFPGIFLHELAHYIAAILTGARVGEFRVGFEEGHVIHSKPRLPLIGMPIISFAPFIIGVIVLVYVFQWLLGVSITEITSVQELISYILHLNYFAWHFWLSLLILINILATFAPSSRDLKNSIIPILFYSILSLFIRSLDPLNIFLMNVFIIVLVIQVFVIGIIKIVTSLKIFR